jgi:hypothetical protein
VDQIRVFLIALVIGLVIGSVFCGIIVSRADSESIRVAQEQLINAQESGRAIAIEADRLRASLESSQGIILGITETNRALELSNKHLTESNQRTIDSVQRAIVDVAGLNQSSADIAETIERIIRIVNSLEQTYFELGNGKSNP